MDTTNKRWYVPEIDEILYSDMPRGVSEMFDMIEALVKKAEKETIARCAESVLAQKKVYDLETTDMDLIDPFHIVGYNRAVKDIATAITSLNKPI